MINIAGMNKWEMAQKFGNAYGKEEAAAMIEVLKNGAATNNTNVRQFENEFAEFVGAQYGVAANSWVGAANMLVLALGIHEGDEIIVPALTFQASANIFVEMGAKIVFADIDRRTFNIDPEKLEEKITSKTKAIVVVHMCGQPADLEPISQIARKHNLILIQDAAHAHGAMYHNKKLASYGDYVIYSFHQGKNMSTLGEGGMVVSNSKQVTDYMRKVRGHGSGKYLGISCRMTEMQGAVGRIQLKRLKGFNEHRRKIAHHLTKRLESLEGILVPYEIPDIYHVYHIYNIIIEPEILKMNRDEFITKLLRKGKILAATQYYPTVNCLDSYTRLGYGKGLCPVAEHVSENLVSLPISVNLQEEDMDEMAEVISKIVHMEE